jgi:hypothetical protein
MKPLLDQTEPDPHEQEVLRLHRELAAAQLRAQQGWERYESANRARVAREAQLAEANRQLHELRVTARQQRLEGRRDQHELHIVLVNENLNLHDRIKADRARIIELEQELADDDILRTRMTELLTGVANVLKGPPRPRSRHDWSDLPRVASLIVAERDELVRAANATNSRPEPS